jgi:predicted RNA binding protein YcfA (HicA-like mRNA interferase family)
MPPLPIIAGADCVQALRKFGYEPSRQKGSHVRMLCSILRTADIEVDVFVAALRR